MYIYIHIHIHIHIHIKRERDAGDIGQCQHTAHLEANAIYQTETGHTHTNTHTRQEQHHKRPHEEPPPSLTKHLSLILNEQAEAEAVRVACLEADTDVFPTQNQLS